MVTPLGSNLLVKNCEQHLLGAAHCYLCLYRAWQALLNPLFWLPLGLRWMVGQHSLVHHHNVVQHRHGAAEQSGDEVRATPLPFPPPFLARCYWKELRESGLKLEGQRLGRSCFSFLVLQGFHCPGCIWPGFWVFLYCFNNNSRRCHSIEEDFKQKKITLRHCYRNTFFLRFIDLKNFLSNKTSKTAGLIQLGS